MKKENGVISLIVLFVMLFLLVFTLTIYVMIEDKQKTQNLKDIELKQVYYKNQNDVEQNLYADNNTIIPIYNINQLNIVGTGSYLEVNGKIYQCSIGKNYELKNNIIIDVNEVLNSVNIGFNDFKFYSDTYHIDKSFYDCYYYYNNSYWKAICYQKFDEKSSENNNLIDKDIIESYKFSIINQIEYPNSNLSFLNICKNEKGEIIDIFEEKQNNKPNSLYDINAFKNHIESINMKNGEFYILISVGKEIK